MQTFLPYADFTRSAAVLDRARLGKQRVEALQVLRGLIVPGYGWRNHPAVRMWTGYEEALVRYGLDMCAVWVAEGRADTCAATLVTDFTGHRPGKAVRGQGQLAEAGELPPWLGEPAFHHSHQSALVRKAPEFYAPLFPDAPEDVPYVWPASDRAAP
ncbi:MULTISPECIES: MSMEG_6728 family protein [Streptomyces]|uniref:Cytoplasmic protein n=1 Tax=Streptomyces apricus TaxID=1828112 RepID=A0A5B0BAW4_9ACTN|nr:MSMEG_6728 family protein [Streptomyces apricus]KAA0938741.1 cytoplasmic protein [Streptomyces apricus]